MNIQIFGTKKSKVCRKAERFFKERGISYHFLDITIKPMSQGEISKVASVVGLDALIDEHSKAYEKKGLAYMDFDILEELQEEPMLLKTPVVRNGLKATVGDAENVWKTWIKEGEL